MWIGHWGGTLGPFENFGTKSEPAFEYGRYLRGKGTQNMLKDRGRRRSGNCLRDGYHETGIFDMPTAVDIDGDGDFDLIVGSSRDGSCQNIGTRRRQDSLGGTLSDVRWNPMGALWVVLNQGKHNTAQPIHQTLTRALMLTPFGRQQNSSGLHVRR